MGNAAKDGSPPPTKKPALTTAAEAPPQKQRGNEEQRLTAELGLSSIVPNATTVCRFAKGTFGDLDLTETVALMTAKVVAVRDGDLGGLETTLLTQAVALDTIFNELARRAAVHMDNNLPAAETFLRLGLKAQAQSRATLQALAEIKNPQPLAFVKQANIAHGPQQVNNGGSAAPPVIAPARARNFSRPVKRTIGDRS